MDATGVQTWLGTGLGSIGTRQRDLERLGNRPSQPVHYMETLDAYNNTFVEPVSNAIEEIFRAPVVGYANGSCVWIQLEVQVVANDERLHTHTKHTRWVFSDSTVHLT